MLLTLALAWLMFGLVWFVCAVFVLFNPGPSLQEVLSRTLRRRRIIIIIAKKGRYDKTKKKKEKKTPDPSPNVQFWPLSFDE